MYATTTSGHRTYTSGNKESKVLQQLIIWNNVAGAIIQDTSTTVEEWFGLNQSDALATATASEQSTLNGTTRSYLGSAVLTSSGGAWIRVPACWGTKVTSTYQRMGDTNCYQVTKTTTVYTVRGYGNGTTFTLE